MATATGPAAPPVEMPAEPLIDRYLPRYDVGRIEHRAHLAEADLATTWPALRELDLAQVHTSLIEAATM